MKLKNKFFNNESVDKCCTYIIGKNRGLKNIEEINMKQKIAVTRKKTFQQRERI